MKHLIASAIFLFTCTQAFAAELTPENLVGQYGVSARVGFRTVNLNFKVLNTTEFELQRIFSDGRKDQVCNGSYKLNRTLFWHREKLAPGKIFNGVFTCPDDRSREVDFNIDFAHRTTENLIKGTEVTVTSSLAAGMRVKAYVKKQ